MAGAVPLLFLLLVLLVFLPGAAPQETPKPGQCPRARARQNTSCSNATNLCSKDGDCAGDLKCCSDGCDVKMCRFAVTRTKSGVCPPLSGTPCSTNITEDACNGDDFQCPGDQKCCAVSCGKACRRPGAKSGSCPPVPSDQCTTTNQPDSCVSDFNCPRNQKCCEGVCSKSCVEPVQQ